MNGFPPPPDPDPGTNGTTDTADTTGATRTADTSDGTPGLKEYTVLALLVAIALTALAATVLAVVRGADTATRDAFTTALIPARDDSPARVVLGVATLLTLVTGGLLLAGGRFRLAGLRRAHRAFTVLAVLSVPAVFWVTVDAADALVFRTAS